MACFECPFDSTGASALASLSVSLSLSCSALRSCDFGLPNRCARGLSSCAAGLRTCAMPFSFGLDGLGVPFAEEAFTCGLVGLVAFADPFTCGLVGFVATAEPLTMLGLSVPLAVPLPRGVLRETGVLGLNGHVPSGLPVLPPAAASGEALAMGLAPAAFLAELSWESRPPGPFLFFTRPPCGHDTSTIVPCEIASIKRWLLSGYSLYSWSYLTSITKSSGDFASGDCANERVTMPCPGTST
mmetsp:Transcript_6659/g.14223  ORF Transcript_6659/g.14223 Transcript_6659/m.14223 type:complete len:242 (-) Transcript_6659:913-1638(-)